MYIGSVGMGGLNHLVYEIVDNSVDEYLAGYCTEITVTIEDDDSVTVSDNGRGIPVDMHEKGVSAERVIMTTLHAGGKFDNNAYKTSGGLHGVGSSVVNALSEYMEIKVSKGGKVYYDSYAKGIPTVDLENGLLPVIGRAKGTGTTITFKADAEIFEHTTISKEYLERLKTRLHETCWLNPGLKITYVNQRKDHAETVVYSEPDGLKSFIQELNKDKNPLHDPILAKGQVGDIEVEMAL